MVIFKSDPQLKMNAVQRCKLALTLDTFPTSNNPTSGTLARISPIFEVCLNFDNNCTFVKFHDCIIHSCTAVTTPKIFPQTDRHMNTCQSTQNCPCGLRPHFAIVTHTQTQAHVVNTSPAVALKNMVPSGSLLADSRMMT